MINGVFRWESVLGDNHMIGVGPTAGTHTDHQNGLLSACSTAALHELHVSLVGAPIEIMESLRALVEVETPVHLASHG